MARIVNSISEVYDISILDAEMTGLAQQFMCKLDYFNAISRRKARSSLSWNPMILAYWVLRDEPISMYISMASIVVPQSGCCGTSLLNADIRSNLSEDLNGKGSHFSS